ncbi:hypothetical protein ACFC7A_31695 [Streptomyces niveus]|uniref:hypothetical protein n=1 Tax=Streptomyces niveus TaxID=193462 RepID=UPI0035E28408
MPIRIRTTADELAPHKHLVIPADGGEILGVVLDEQGAIPTRGRFAAWSPKAGTRNGQMGFYHSLDEAADAIGALFEPGSTTPEPPGPAAPEWRTLKGVTTPFDVLGVRDDRGRILLASDRRTPTGGPITVVRLEMRNGLRRGKTADGAEVNFSGTASKYWVVASDN